MDSSSSEVLADTSASVPVDAPAVAAPVAAPAAPPSPPQKEPTPTSTTTTPPKSDETTKGAIAEKFAQASLLDMVFVMDCTGSMGSYIASAQATIAEIVQQIVSAEKADVRFALISYRDHPPQDSTYVINQHPFTSSVKTMRTNLDTLSAQGGGDGPEAVVDGLHAASKLEYRSDATKVVILIADAPPHGLGGSGDGFPNGCPCGLDPMVVCRSMAENNIALYCIGCEPSLTPYKSFFMAMAHVTGGQYCPLGDAHVLSSAVVSGVREEMSLAAALADVKMAVEACGEMDEAAQTEFVHNKLKEKNVRSKQMKHDGGAASALTDDAIAMSKADNLDSIRGKYNMGGGSDGGGAYGARMYAAAPMMACSASPMRNMKKKSAVPAAESGGFLGSVRNFLGFGGSASGGEGAEGAECCDDADECAMAAPMAAPSFAPAASASMPSSYRVVEDDISMEQTSRLMNKAKFQSKK